MSEVSDTYSTPESLESQQPVESRRIGLFLLVAFGLSGLAAVAVYFTGGITDSPEVIAGIPLWLILVSSLYMFSPAIANVVTRLATDEGFADLRIRPHLRANVRTYLVAWLAPPVVFVAGAGLFFGLFPQYFDPNATQLRGLLPPGVSVELVIAAQLVQGLLFGATLNALLAFGEELGWRAYLLQKLFPLGRRRAVLVTGLVWGVWHWPIIALGYNYGFGYPGAPWTGFLAMTWLTVTTGTFFAWVALRADSVWPAALAHGVVNAFAGLGILFATADAPTLLGPVGTGVVVVAPWALLAVVLLSRSPVFEG